VGKLQCGHSGGFEEFTSGNAFAIIEALMIMAGEISPEERG